jgi:hypothetical protein
MEAQEFQENIFCASSVVECVDSTFICLLINCNPTDEVLKTLPQTHKLPKLSGKFAEISQKEQQVRNRLLQAQLRLPHLKEGEQEIRQICTEYANVFKLPRDKLTATSAIEHCIPTPTIPTNTAITLRNYRIP